ncbi:hypothetical protein KC19_VG323400 [Ceratodon purpureus]|uniref:Uncharacterized protein n=1 Tax=Ceratodon purpureus TaxID=3225 RepID=A0A8T0HVU6_CERPU|nr:hypothetical protein KC19_VG323400 [Ceratodon purpureus]
MQDCPSSVLDHTQQGGWRAERKRGETVIVQQATK